MRTISELLKTKLKQARAHIGGVVVVRATTHRMCAQNCGTYNQGASLDESRTAGPGQSTVGLSGESGGAEEDRTPDLLRARQALSQLSYGPVVLSERPELHNAESLLWAVRRA